MFRDHRVEGEPDILMAVASNSSVARYNHENEIAENEDHDTIAAEKDSYDYQASESGEPTEEVSDDQDAEDDAASAGYEKAFENERYRPARRRSKITPKIINEELKWLTDPKKMANRVGQILHSGDPALAAAVVRTGTKYGMRCDIAWNLLLHYSFDQENPQAAFKFWNDVSLVVLWDGCWATCVSLRLEFGC